MAPLSCQHHQRSNPKFLTKLGTNVTFSRKFELLKKLKNMKNNLPWSHSEAFLLFHSDDDFELASMEFSRFYPLGLVENFVKNLFNF